MLSELYKEYLQIKKLLFSVLHVSVEFTEWYVFQCLLYTVVELQRCSLLLLALEPLLLAHYLLIINRDDWFRKYAKYSGQYLFLAFFALCSVMLAITCAIKILKYKIRTSCAFWKTDSIYILELVVSHGIFLTGYLKYFVLDYNPLLRIETG